MARVGGKPKMISERYLGSAEQIVAALDAQETASMPQRTRHLSFGDVAAVWGMLDRLALASIVDEVVGPRRSDAGASVGTYLALATLNRVVAPCSKLGFRAIGIRAREEAPLEERLEQRGILGEHVHGHVRAGRARDPGRGLVVAHHDQERAVVQVALGVAGHGLERIVDRARVLLAQHVVVDPELLGRMALLAERRER
jgi:hypothetical protein